MRWMPLLLVVAGCGSYWDLRSGESLNTDCEGKLNYYVDLDGDGWGEPSSAPEPLCAPDPNNNLTASNNRDCDDNDDGITARIEQCPASLVPADGDYLGIVRGDSEYLAIDVPDGIRYSGAASLCDTWGSRLPGDDGEGEADLAQLVDGGERDDILDALESAGWTDVELFVGIVWNGDAWVWADGDPLSGTVGFCGNNADIEPIDFFANLVDGIVADDGQDAEDAAARLSLRREADGSDWCWGIPGEEDVIDDSRAFAGVLCERGAPSTADYQSVPDSEG